MIDKYICSLRRFAFFFLDSLQGGTIRKAYSRLIKFQSHSMDSQEFIEYQEAALKELLNHAIETTEFYSHIGERRLEAFPVINKDIIRDQQSRFMSRIYSNKKLHKAYTSGSTGTPFCCYQDMVKRKHVIAELLYYSRAAGYNIGERIFQVAGQNRHNERPKLKQWMRNHRMFLIEEYSDESIGDIIQAINSGEGSTFLGYASTYDSLKKYFDSHGNHMVAKDKVKGIISNGQMLFDDVRASMEEAFGCRCFSRYSNEENGIIGIDGIENNVFTLNESHYHIEILKLDRDEPVKEGELGRIVLTDLYNRAQPIIRYDTGDVGSIKLLKEGDAVKRAISDFGGRKLDMIFNANGNIVYPHVIAENFEHFPEISQFQVIQESKVRYRLRINVGEHFGKHEKLKELFKKFLGESAEIIIEMVDEVPILSSGKRKMMINLMEQV